MGVLNGLFVLGRSIGLIAHFLDQKRLRTGLYRHPWDGKSSISHISTQTNSNAKTLPICSLNWQREDSETKAESKWRHKSKNAEGLVEVGVEMGACSMMTAWSWLRRFLRRASRWDWHVILWRACEKKCLTKGECKGIYTFSRH